MTPLHETVAELLAMFRSVPPLELADVEGWWDPGRAIRLQCEAHFLLEPHQAADETTSDGDEPGVTEEAKSSVVLVCPDSLPEQVCSDVARESETSGDSMP
jgi:hypothetical protein